MSQDWDYTYSLDLCPQVLLRGTVLPSLSRCAICHLDCRGGGGNGKGRNRKYHISKAPLSYFLSATGRKRRHGIVSILHGFVVLSAVLADSASLGSQPAVQLSPTENNWGKVGSAPVSLLIWPFTPSNLSSSDLNGQNWCTLSLSFSFYFFFFLEGHRIWTGDLLICSPSISFKNFYLFFKWHECSS